MAKKVKKENNSSNDEVLIDAKDKFEKFKNYFNENKKLTTAISSIVFLVILFFSARQLWFAPSNEKSIKGDMITAEAYFPVDSFNLAINGDGQYKGFVSIINEYEKSFPFYLNSKSAELAKYYAGISYLNMGEYQNAINYLSDFSSEDFILSSLAKGCTGDAYWELGDIDNAIKSYNEAIENSNNLFTAPRFMKKLARLYELNNNVKEANKLYNKIKKDYKESHEAKDIDLFISRTK